VELDRSNGPLQTLFTPEAKDGGDTWPQVEADVLEASKIHGM